MGCSNILSISNRAAPGSAQFDVKFMRLRSYRILAGTFVLLLTGVVVGQNTTVISLDQAIDLALTHNHSIEATRTLILQNQALEITANLRPNPSLGADSQFIPIFSPGDFSADDLNLTQQFDIGISYLFERGHKRQRRLQAPPTRPRSPAPRSRTPSARWLSMWDSNSSAFCWRNQPFSSRSRT